MNIDPVKFWAKVDKTDGCWLWSQVPSSNGYGIFQPKRGQMILAHRASWILTFGEIPPGVKILHKCDNTLCVRPDHLFEGTQKDNIHDMIRKGRRFQYDGKGERNGMFGKGYLISGSKNGRSKERSQL